MPLPTRRNDPMRTPTWFKVWFAICAVLGVGFLALIAWAVITLVNHITGS